MAQAKKTTAKKDTTTATTTKPVAEKTTTTTATKPVAEKTATKTTATKPVAEKTATKTTKAPAKKSPAKKTTKAKEPVVSVAIEFDGGQERVNEIVENIKKVYASKENASEIKTLEVFVKPEERKAYYIVNGELDSQNQMDVYF